VTCRKRQDRVEYAVPVRFRYAACAAPRRDRCRCAGKNAFCRICPCREAARLLQESDLPVAEIAHRVGYEDPSRFAAAFRRHTGRRPTELRKQPHRVRFSCLPRRGAKEIFSEKIHSAHRTPFQSTPVVTNRCRIMCKPYRFARWGTFYTPSQVYYSKGDLNYELGKDRSVCRRRSVWLRRY
jgi:AraC-like DNA-binding protein